MALTIYGAVTSRTARTIWMCKEHNIPFEHVPVSQRDGSTRKPEHLKLNPNGHVPVIKDGDFVMWESLAINIYLANKYPGPLTPKTLEEQARTVQWSMWALTEMEPNSTPILQHTILLPEDKRDPAVAARAREGVKAPLNVLEAELGSKDYLLGDRFTVVDLNVSHLVSTLIRVKYDLSGWPKVSAWLARCSARPAAAAVREMAAAA